MPRPLFIHVGSSKTGTSALQEALWESKDYLRSQGVGLPFVGRPEHVRRLLRPLGWVAAEGFVKDVRTSEVRALAKVLRATPGERLLMSNEDLAELPADRVALLLEVAQDAGLDVHVVLTARDWARQLPSEWQQFLKHRLTTDYPTFLEEVRDRRGPAATHYWCRQNILDIAGRWSSKLEPDRMHVIAVPSRSDDKDGVYRLFGEAVGFDALGLTQPKRDVNASFGYVEAEVLRRLNATLGKRVADYEGEYYPAVRIPLVSGMLPRQASPRITLPPDHLEWVCDVSRTQVDALASSGFKLYGDLGRLVPGPDAAAPLPELDERAVADAAVETLARALVRPFKQKRAAKAKGA